MRVCILNELTQTVENVIEIDHPDNFKPHKSGLIISPRHDGQIGWILENNEWINPGASIKDDSYYARGIRRRRQFKLSTSDKYVLSDFPISEEKKSEWLAYRQLLRNITDQPGFPRNVVWPTEPE